MASDHVNWNYPTTIHFGAGRVSELPQVCQQQGIRKPLLVTDPGLAASPMVVKVVELFQSQAVDISCFSDI